MSAKVYIQTNGYAFAPQFLETFKTNGYQIQAASTENLPHEYFDFYFICVASPHQFHQYAKKLTPSLVQKVVFVTIAHFPYRAFSEGQWPQIQWDIVGENWDGAVLEQIISKYAHTEQKVEIEKYPGFVHFESASTQMKSFESEYQKGLMHAALASASAVVITGEKGVGKRHMTEHLIRNFIPGHALYKICLEDFNGNHEMVDQVLFGDVNQIGCLELAGNGFVYVQEVQMLSKSTQDRLADCLHNKQIKHKSLQGESVDVPLGCHFIFSSSEDLGFLVRSGKFSEPLLQQAGPYKFEMPHLAARHDDIVYLAEQMVEYFNVLNHAKCDGLSNGALSTLKQYPWPHNTEELWQCLQVVVAPNFAGNIEQQNIPDQYKPRGKTQLNELLPTTPVPYQLAKQNLLDYFNDYYAHFLLNHTHFNFSAAARLAGMDRSNFRRLFKEYLGDHYSKETGDSDMNDKNKDVA